MSVQHVSLLIKGGMRQLLRHAHPTAFRPYAVSRRNQKPFFNQKIGQGFHNRQRGELIGKAPFSQQVFRNCLAEQFGQLPGNDLGRFVKISCGKSVGNIEYAFNIFYVIYQNLCVKHVSLAVQVAFFHRFGCRLLFLPGKGADGQSVYGAEGQLNGRIGCQIQSAVKVGSDMGGVDIVHADSGITADMGTGYAVPTIFVHFAVCFMGIDAEGPCGFFYVRKILFGQNAFHIVDKSVCNFVHLLPEDQVQVNLPVQVRKGKVFLSVGLYKVCQNAADGRQVFRINAMCRLYGIFVEQDEIQGI